MEKHEHQHDHDKTSMGQPRKESLTGWKTCQVCGIVWPSDSDGPDPNISGCPGNNPANPNPLPNVAHQWMPLRTATFACNNCGMFWFTNAPVHYGCPNNNNGPHDWR